MKESEACSELTSVLSPFTNQPNTKAVRYKMKQAIAEKIMQLVDKEVIVLKDGMPKFDVCKDELDPTVIIVKPLNETARVMFDVLSRVGVDPCTQMKREEKRDKSRLSYNSEK